MQERIALLFGIPITREEFFERAETFWDYGRRLMAGRSAVRALEDIYLGVCSVARNVVEAAQGSGVTVCRRATLSDLEDISRSHEVLILVAHWRGSIVDADDLLPGWLQRLSVAARDDSSRDAVAVLLRGDLPLGAAVASASGDGAPLRRLAADTLSRLIKGDYFVKWLPAGLGREVETGKKILEALSRDLVDSILSDCIRPGNQLELWDGLYSVAAVDAALSSNFVGTLDLSCCTSSVLGTYLSTVRSAAIDVIMGDPLIAPIPQLRLIQGILEAISADDNLRYELARRAISQGLGGWRPRPPQR